MLTHDPSSRLERTTIAIDRGAAEAAQTELGTKTLGDTVNASLREIGARAARRRLVERLSTGLGTDLANPHVMRSAWR